MDYKTLLQKNGLKATPKRIAVLSILEQTKKPVSIEEISSYLSKRKINADQVTLYRIIETFLNINLVHKIDFLEGKFRYEISSKPHHHHAICTECGQIEDLHEDIFGNIVHKVSKESNFYITNHAIEFFGLCHNCK